MDIVSETLIAHTSYSENNKFVFQYLWLNTLAKRWGEENAKQIIGEYLLVLLENTAKRYEVEMSTSQNKQWYSEALHITRKAKKMYEMREGEIVIFYGNYQDKNERIVFRFKMV